MDSRALDAKLFGLAIDAFAGAPLNVEGVEEWAVAVERDAHLPTQLPINIFDTAPAFEKLLVVTGCLGGGGVQERTTEAEGLIAVGMLEGERRRHGQGFGAERGAITGAREGGMAVLIEGDGSNPAMKGSFLVDVPGIKGGVSGQMRRKCSQSQGRLLIEGRKMGDVIVVEGRVVSARTTSPYSAVVAAATPEP